MSIYLASRAVIQSGHYHKTPRIKEEICMTIGGSARPTLTSRDDGQKDDWSNEGGAHVGAASRDPQSYPRRWYLSLIHYFRENERKVLSRGGGLRRLGGGTTAQTIILPLVALTYFMCGDGVAMIVEGSGGRRGGRRRRRLAGVLEGGRVVVVVVTRERREYNRIFPEWRPIYYRLPNN